MTRRLGGTKKTLAAIASLSLAATLACAGVMSGCGSSNSGSSPDASSDGTSMNPMADSAVEDTYVAPVDHYVADTYVADGYVADAGMEAQAALLPPTFNPPTNTNNPGSVTIVAPANFPEAGNAFIYYTTNGTNPTTTSTVFTPGSPIKITGPTQIRAYATAPGFADSPIATATYTVSVEAGTLLPPSFSPAGGTAAAPTSRSNDFPVTLTSTPGATICFTLDGTMPACNAGVCQGTTQTYNAQGVPISGSVTSATTVGIATLNAIACQSGLPTTAVSTAVYELQAAQPALQTPTPGTLPYQSAAQTPTASSATTLATLHYTTGSAAVSCTTSLTLPAGGAATNPAAVPPFTTSTTYNVIACKAGYVPSNPLAAAYVVQLNPPVFGMPGGATYSSDVSPGIAAAAADPGGSADWVCYTAGTTSTQPVCDTTSGGSTHGCTTGSNIAVGSPPTVVTNGTIINAVTCTADATKYVSSGVVSSGTYTMQLAPIAFTPNGGSLGTTNMRSVTIANSATGTAKAYTGICYSMDGTTVPACSTTVDNACATGGGSFVAGDSSSGVTLTATTNNLTFRAIGCPGTQAGDSNKGYLPTVAAQAVFSAAGQLTAPVMHPGTGTQNNDVNVTFDNTNAVPVDICFTTDGSAVTFASANSCTPTGTAVCVTAVAASATGVAATGNPIVTATGATVIARACDPNGGAGGSTQSPPQSATYTLQVGTVTISPASGSPNIGSLVTFSTPTAGTTFHIQPTNGTANCSSGTTVVATGTGPYTATYQLQGTETTINVVGCKGSSGQYTPSATASVTYTSFAVATPTFLFGTAASTFQDLLDGTVGAGTTEQVQVNPSTASTPTWICQKSSSANALAPACGTTLNSCATGSPSSVNNAVITSTAACTNTNVVGDCFNDPVNATGTTLNVVACSLPSGGSVISSAPATANYTLQVSPITFSPTPGAITGGSVTVSATLGTANQGPTSATPTQADASNNVMLCLTSSQVVPVQPSPCNTFGGAAPNWQCTTCTTGTCTATWTPAIGATTSFNAFACKDGMTYSTTSGSPASYTLGAYSDPITLRGSVSDFKAPAEAIALLGPTTVAHPSNGGNAFVSWDTTHLYFGFQSADIVAVPAGYVHFYIGCGGGAPCGSGTSTVDNVSGAVSGGGTLPSGFNGLYHVYWTAASGAKVDSYNGSNWVAAPTISSNPLYNGGANTFVEFSILRSDLSMVGNDVHLLGGYTTGSDATDVWPTTGSPASPHMGNCDTVAVTASGTCASPSANWTDWQTEYLNQSFSPNDRVNLSIQ